MSTVNPDRNRNPPSTPNGSFRLESTDPSSEGGNRTCQTCTQVRNEMARLIQGIGQILPQIDEMIGILEQEQSLPQLGRREY